MTNECKVFESHLLHTQAFLAHKILVYTHVFSTKIGKVDCYEMIVDFFSKTRN